MINKGLFTSNTDNWATPQWFFDKLNEKHKFTLDVCASKTNNKCDKFFTLEDNGLKQSWKGETCWMNPPYGKEIKYWIEKAYKEALLGTTIVMLLPARTDTKWFHEFIYEPYKKDDGPIINIEFIKGRLKFGNSKNSAPFPSMIVTYN